MGLVTRSPFWDVEGERGSCGAPPKIADMKALPTVRETAGSSHEVSCPSSTCDDRASGSRNAPASPPVGFGYPYGSLLRRDPTRENGSASEVFPSEVSPSAVRGPVSGVRPSCRWSRGAPRLQGTGRLRSVGAAAPRSSPGFSSSRAFPLEARRETLSGHGTFLCLVSSVPEGRDSTALQGLFCFEIRFPLSR